MKSKDDVWKKACSTSMNKWIGIIEEETEIVSFGSNPTQKMHDLIDKIKHAIATGENFDTSIDELIQETFDKGVQSGFAKGLAKFIDGSITTKKIRNEDSWILSTNSKQYQITAKLPSAGEKTIQTTSYIKISEHGFE
ncbi:hypothetical protein [Pseudoalteromonas sp. M8]|uniref:hypothetical protein n=1 Tax=Pseudoalteromonas sp. M8 TaxID=2692624 RepID=UPI001BA8C6A4|nr:hypothetical protein [Pseudoalteromonas sp. M8]QUI70698.1 hypothetical protein GSF13_13455 [Pseudoalteromonas sp. M8]